MLGRTDRHLRMVALLVVFTLFGSATMLRLGYWQVVAAPDLVSRAVDTMAPPPAMVLARAEIIDRDGVTLAQSASFDRLDANPRDIPEERRAQIMATLTEILELSPEEQAAYQAKLSSGSAWDWLARRLTPEQSVEIALAKDEGKLPGSRWPRSRRASTRATAARRTPASPATCWASWLATAAVPTAWSASTRTASRGRTVAHWTWPASLASPRLRVTWRSRTTGAWPWRRSASPSTPSCSAKSRSS